VDVEGAGPFGPPVSKDSCTWTGPAAAAVSAASAVRPGSALTRIAVSASTAAEMSASISTVRRSTESGARVSVGAGGSSVETGGPSRRLWPARAAVGGVLTHAVHGAVGQGGDGE